MKKITILKIGSSKNYSAYEMHVHRTPYIVQNRNEIKRSKRASKINKYFLLLFVKIQTYRKPAKCIVYSVHISIELRRKEGTDISYFYILSSSSINSHLRIHVHSAQCVCGRIGMKRRRRKRKKNVLHQS